MGQMGHTSAVPSDSFILPHGGYAGLLAYQKALIIFQATCRFCERFLDKRDRTVDQMIQAARLGKQNMVQGSKVSGTSKEAEIKPLNVSRSSLEELLEDYKDFLRRLKLRLWPKSSREALFVRKLAGKQNVTYETYIEARSPEVVANILICLIHQTNYLLDKLLRRLEKDLPRGRRPARTHDTRATSASSKAKRPHCT